MLRLVPLWSSMGFVWFTNQLCSWNQNWKEKSKGCRKGKSKTKGKGKGESIRRKKKETIAPEVEQREIGAVIQVFASELIFVAGVLKAVDQMCDILPIEASRGQIAERSKTPAQVEQEACLPVR